MALVRPSAIDNTETIIEHGVVEGAMIGREGVGIFLCLMTRKDSVLPPLASGNVDTAKNRDAIFPAVHRGYKFSLLTIGRAVGSTRFAFFLTNTAQLADSERCFGPSLADTDRIKPNPKTAPIFRARADAALTTKIHEQAPVLVQDNEDDQVNPWRVRVFTRLWNMTEDAAWFRTAHQLQEMGFLRHGADWFSSKRSRDIERYVPLYE